MNLDFHSLFHHHLGGHFDSIIHRLTYLPDPLLLHTTIMTPDLNSDHLLITKGTSITFIAALLRLV